jgi:hypothetical protein
MVITTLEATREFTSSNLENLRKACCYAFADYICKLAGDYVDSVDNKYFEPFIAAGPQFNWNIGDKVFTWENIGEYTKQVFDMQGSSISLNLGGGAVLFDCIQLHVNYNIALGKIADYSNFSGLVHNIYEAKINKWQLSATYLF